MRVDGRKGAFLWDVPTFPPEVDLLAEFAKRLGLDYVLVKVADGTERYGDPFTQANMADTLRAEGVPMVGAWGYCYGTDGPTFGAELARGAADIDADLVVVDWEPTQTLTTQAGRDTLQQIHQQLMGAELQLPFVFCGLPEPAYHTEHPYWWARELGWWGLPMAYHNAMELDPQTAVDRTLQQWGAYGWLPSELVMGAGAYSEPFASMLPGDVARFAAAAFVAGCRSICYWSLDWLWLHRESFLVPEVAAVSVPPFIPDAEEGETHPAVPADDDRAPF